MGHQAARPEERSNAAAPIRSIWTYRRVDSGRSASEGSGKRERSERWWSERSERSDTTGFFLSRRHWGFFLGPRLHGVFFSPDDTAGFSTALDSTGVFLSGDNFGAAATFHPVVIPRYFPPVRVISHGPYTVLQRGFLIPDIRGFSPHHPSDTPRFLTGGVSGGEFLRPRSHDRRVGHPVSYPSGYKLIINTANLSHNIRKV